MADDVVAGMTADQQAALAENVPVVGQQHEPSAPVASAPVSQGAATSDSQPPAASAPTIDTQPAPPPPDVQPQAAAVVTPDPWAEYEEIQHEDSDTGESYTVRAPKSYAAKVKNGYARRTIMDRQASYLGPHRQWLEPIATSGQLDGVAPIIQQAIQDKEYAEAVVQALNRRRMGLPMWEQQQVSPPVVTPAPGSVPVASATPLQAPDLLAHIDADPELDDWTKARFKASLAPFAQAFQQFNEVRSSFTQQQQQWQQQQQQQRETTERNDRARREGDAAAQAMMRQFPGRTQDEYQRAWTYGQQSGLFQQYGVNGATAILAYQGYSNPMGLTGLGREPIPSTAANTLAQAAAQGQRLAAAAAATVATATTVTGAGAPTDDPNAKQRLVRYRTGADGKKRPVKASDLANQMIQKGMV